MTEKKTPISIKRELSKYLTSLQPEELIKEINTLYANHKSVQAYYALELGGEAKAIELLQKYKVKIRKQYFPDKRNGNPKAAKLRSLITEFKKLSPYPMHTIDLMLYRVEQAIDFLHQADGDLSETFYTTTENAFFATTELIKQEKMEVFFKTRCQLIRLSSKQFYWGFESTITHYYDETFSE